MKVIHRFVVLSFLIVLGLSANVVAQGKDSPGGRPLSTELSGANEVPPADNGGSGMAHLTLNQGKGEVCYELTVSEIAPATGAHIHAAPAGANGGVVVPLDPPTEGSSSGCVSDVDKDLIKDIRQNPENYYVNVHNADFPGGAVRGQLHKAEDEDEGNE